MDPKLLDELLQARKRFEYQSKHGSNLVDFVQAAKDLSRVVQKVLESEAKA
jgi:hypothetical protein